MAQLSLPAARDPYFVEVDDFEVFEVRIEGEHRLVAFPCQHHGMGGLDGVYGDKKRVPEGAVGHEDAFAVWNVGAHVAPESFRADQKRLYVHCRATGLR